MNTDISQHVDAMIAAEDMPWRANLRPITQFSCLQEDDPDEAEARSDFIAWYLGREHQLIELIPKQEGDFWLLDLDEFGIDQSAINTWDYDRLHPGRFNIHHWQLKAMCEKVKSKAIDFSIVRDKDTRMRIREGAFEFIRTRGGLHKETLFQVWLDYAYWV